MQSQGSHSVGRGWRSDGDGRRGSPIFGTLRRSICGTYKACSYLNFPSEMHRAEPSRHSVESQADCLGEDQPGEILGYQMSLSQERNSFGIKFSHFWVRVSI